MLAEILATVGCNAFRGLGHAGNDMSLIDIGKHDDSLPNFPGGRVKHA